MKSLLATKFKVEDMDELHYWYQNYLHSSDLALSMPLHFELIIQIQHEGLETNYDLI